MSSDVGIKWCDDLKTMRKLQYFRHYGLTCPINAARGMKSNPNQFISNTGNLSTIFLKFKFLDYNQLILYRLRKAAYGINTFQLRRGIHSRCRCWSKGYRNMEVDVNINSFHNYFNKYHFKRYNVSIWCKYRKFYIMDQIANSWKS